MEFAEGMNLREVGKRYNMDWQEKRRVFVEIAKALRVLHAMNIVHRDIKPENIVYNPKNRSIKLIDFGFSAQLSNKSIVYSNCGTPGYAPPESYTKNYSPTP